MNDSRLAESGAFCYVDRTGIRGMSFIRVPKFLLEESLFQTISVDAALLYSILLDRLELSLVNDWFDDQGHAYVIYTIKEIQRILRCGHDKAIKLLRELDTQHGIGLIERIRLGQGQPSIIYVKVYSPKNRPPKVDNTELWKSEDQTSGLRKNRFLEVEKAESSKTNCSKTEYNETERVSSRHRYGAYHNVLLSDADVEQLKKEFPDDYEERIERLSEYIASKGAKYTNHLATIRSWDRRERRERERRYRHENYETEDTL